jgi:hypothetical protein
MFGARFMQESVFAVVNAETNGLTRRGDKIGLHGRHGEGGVCVFCERVNDARCGIRMCGAGDNQQNPDPQNSTHDHSLFVSPGCPLWAASGIDH